MRLVIALAPIAVLLMASSLACCFSAPSIPGFWRTARGSGHVVEETRSVHDFTGVRLAGIGNLYIELGGEESLRLEAEDNLIPHLEIAVKGSTLEIGTEPGVDLRPTEPVNFYLTVTELDSIGVSGSGGVEARSLEINSLSVSVSGSGDVEIGTLEASDLTVRVSGSGDVTISGEVNEQDVTISGSGTYKAGELESSRAGVRVSGSGSATVQVSDYLDATVSGSGSVHYIGSPTVESSTSGSGSIQQIND